MLDTNTFVIESDIILERALARQAQLQREADESFAKECEEFKALALADTIASYNEEDEEALHYTMSPQVWI